MGHRPFTDPYSNGTLLVNQVIGTPYQNVRAVAGYLEQIKVIADNISELMMLSSVAENAEQVVSNLPVLEAISSRVDEIDALVPYLTQLGAVASELQSLVLVGPHASKIAQVSDEIPELLGLHSKLTQLVNLSTNLVEVLAVSSQLTAVGKVSSNIVAVANVAGSLTGLNAIAANLSSLLAVVNEISNAEAINDIYEDVLEARDRAEAAASGVTSPVSFEPQVLNAAQKTQARSNIGVVNTSTITVGQAVSGANVDTSLDEADTVTGVKSDTDTLVRWSWASIKTWILGNIPSALSSVQSGLSDTQDTLSGALIELEDKAEADLSNVSQAVARAAVGTGSMAYRNLTVSGGSPTGGANGDVWYKV